MSFTRRTFLIGAGTGVSVLVLAACTGPEPTIPTLTPTPQPSDGVPAPVKLWRSNWAADPLAQGAVSFLPVGSNLEDRTALRSPLHNRVFFAGEATSDAPGTVRGAIESGARAAREVIDVVAAKERVGIVGAGAAGAEAARVLTALGIDVIVFEARDRSGGRIDSRVDEDGKFFELGAWELAVEGDSLLIADVDTVPLDGTIAVSVSSGLATGDVADLVAVQKDVSARLAAWANEQSTSDTGIASSLKDSGASAAAGVVGDIPADDMPPLYAEAARLAAGSEPEDISTWFPPTAIGAASVIPTGKLSSIVSTKLDGVTLALSTAVVAVAYDDNAVSLRLGTGESRRVDRAIITVPLGVLKAGAVEFDPPLPLPTRSAIDSVGFGQVEVVRVAFDTAFWTTDAAMWSLVGTDAEITTWVNLQPLTGETTLLGIAAGDAAASLSDVDDAALTQMVRRMLAPFAG
ncbi:flavin monoamine oxidase family protein [Microbacterium deminutum]|uniref:Amine oxidase domain-containing protein n=1 Tax=Microbacterium deminutum TaxID=344164 RepID=A0ABN2QIR2_9MICO